MAILLGKQVFLGGLGGKLPLNIYRGKKLSKRKGNFLNEMVVDCKISSNLSTLTEKLGKKDPFCAKPGATSPLGRAAGVST